MDRVDYMLEHLYRSREEAIAHPEWFEPDFLEQLDKAILQCQEVKAKLTCEISRCDQRAALHCSNCRQKVCVDHAIESEDSGEVLCSQCAILSNGLWRRVRPIPDNGSQQRRREKRAA
jgi:hypothetical protein